MSRYMPSRSIHIFHCASKTTLNADSQTQKIFKTINPNNYDIRASFAYSSWPITKRYHVTPYTISNVQRFRRSFESRHHYATNVVPEKKSRKLLIYLLTALVFGMVGCSYAAVPLYRRFCQATGYGGTVQRRETLEEKIARHSTAGTVTTREVVVQFNADGNLFLPKEK